MKFKRIVCLVLTVVLSVTCTISVFAKDLSKDKNGDGYVTYIESLEFPDRNTKVADTVTNADISFTVNGQLREFKNRPYIKDGEIMVPAKELYEYFNVFLGWEEDIYMLPAGTDAYVGEINGASVAIIPDSDVAWYDDVPLELTTPTVGVENDVYVPLYFVQYMYGIDMKINGGAVTINLTSTQPERPRIVKPFDESALADVESELVIDLDTMLAHMPQDTDGVKYNIIESDDERFDKVLQMTNVNVPTYFYENEGSWDGLSDFDQGDVLVMEIWVRSPEAMRDEGSVPLTAQIQINGHWYERVVGNEFQVGPEWQRFVFVGMSPFDCEVNPVNTWGYSFHLKVGYRKNTTYEIGGLKVTNYKKNITPEETGISRGELVEVKHPLETRGLNDDHIWREEALRRIEKYRKAPATVKVIDENGQPVSDADVKLDMTEHEFMIGWEAQDHSEREPIVIREREDQEKQGFNTITPNASLGQPWTEQNMVDALVVADWARETNTRMRGHAFIYDLYDSIGHSTYAPSVYGNKSPLKIGNGMSYEDTFKIYMSGISGRVVAMNDYVDEWNAINETKDGHTPLVDNYGYEIIQDLFECARLMVKPEARLYYMDSTMAGSSQKDPDSGVNVTEKNIRWNNRESMDLISFEGFTMDGMAGQCHIVGREDGQNRPNPVDYYRQMEVYADRHDYYSVTEYDFVDSQIDMNTDTDLENKLIGLYIRDWFIATFSNPKSTCFSIWESGSDAWHWRSWGPFTDKYFQDKPENLKLWQDMIFKDFASHTTRTTAEDGSYTERVFRGDYDVEVTVNGKTAKTTLKVTENGENIVTAIVKADGIELNTSEKVTTVADRTEHIDIDWFVYNLRNMQQEYLKYSKSELVKATTESGKEVNYLLDKDNKVQWVSSADDSYVTFELKQPLEKGYVVLKWPEDRPAIYQVDGSLDGESWEKIGVCESSERDILPFYEKNYKYIRLSNMSGQPMAPNSVAVYQARYFAKTQ